MAFEGVHHIVLKGFCLRFRNVVSEVFLSFEIGGVHMAPWARMVWAQPARIWSETVWAGPAYQIRRVNKGARPALGIGRVLF